MGVYQPKQYKVKRNGVWITVRPAPKEYVSGSEQRGNNVKRIVHSTKKYKT